MLTSNENNNNNNNNVNKDDLTLSDNLNILDNIDMLNYQLREPISSIFASLPILAENINNLDVEKANKNLQIVYEKTYQMVKNVDNVSLAAKISNKSISSNDLIDYSSLLKSIFNSSSMILPNYIDIDVDIADNAIIKGNRNLLSTAMFNLILNSLDYRIEQNVKIKVTLKIIGKNCVLTYQDNSIGIKESLMSEIFFPYYTKNPYDDGELSSKMGLGLYLVKSAVELSGGTVFTSSTFGEGVKFVLSIPFSSLDDKCILKSSSSDFMINKYSELFIQLCDYCVLPNIV